MKARNQAKIIVFCLLFLALIKPNFGFAAMNSSNYTIWSDGVSLGGDLSSSTNYSLQDTVGESASGENISSTNYLLSAGLPSIFEEPVLLVSLSSATASFSQINSTAVNTAGYNLTVSTNAPFGYTAQATADGNLTSGANFISAVSDGSVTAGSNEYGIAVSGTDAAFGDDRALSTSPLTVASRSNWVSASATAISHKVSVTSGFAAGTYSQIVTYAVIGNF